jgi:hypothetical protein
MSKQIFKKNPPIEFLISLLEKLCLKTEKYYIFNSTAFKKGLYNNIIVNFIEECRPYYHISKQKYLDVPIKYNNFTTILRQICNINKKVYTSQIKYDHSLYEIVYYVYF